MKLHKNAVCPYCDRAFTRWANLKKHIEDVHPDNEVPEWVRNEVENKKRQGQKKPDGTTSKPKTLCPKCGAYLKTTYMQIHNKFKRIGYVCPEETCDYITKLRNLKK